jgi:hypothetical protein
MDHPAIHWDTFRDDGIEELGMTRVAKGVYAALGESEVD